MNSDFTTQAVRLRIDERNHVEKPLLDQLAGLDWEIIDLDSKQHPGDTFSRDLHRSRDVAGAAGTTQAGISYPEFPDNCR